MRSSFALAAGLSGVLAIPSIAQQDLTNEAIWYSPTFSTEYVGGLASMNDGEHYTVQEEVDGAQVVNEYAYRTGEKVATIVNGKDLVPTGGEAPIPMEGYSFSTDEQRLLIETSVEPLYRHSYYAYNYVYDRSTKSLTPLSDVSGSKQRLATLSPDGGRAAFVRDNDLYMVDLATMQETRITHDGEWNKVINGAPDWVYEEEFEFTQGYAWSPRGDKILFLRSDESRVKEYTLTYFRDQLYPDMYSFKYPKAGEENSRVKLMVYDLKSTGTTEVPLGEPDDDPYLPRFGWTNDDDVLWFMQMDRLQRKKLIYTLAVPTVRAVQKGLVPREVYREVSDTYIEVTNDLHFLADGSGFVLSSEKDGWNQVLWCSMDGRTQRAITQGEWDVASIAGVDGTNKRVIFTASMRSPMQQEVYAVGLNGRGLKQLSPVGGTNEAEWSTGFRYFINTHSTANEPYRITLHDGEGRLVKVLKDNAELKATLAEYDLRPKEFLRITTAEGVTLNAWMIKPPGFDAARKYPVLMTQYSGPNSVSVADSWEGRNYLWHELLAQKGYIVVCVDPRGTGRRGHDFRHITYGQLGKYETIDQIGAAKWLADQPYVDADRIGIQGWSYGAYMSSLCITKGADVFKAAIAVAPVTNWRYYDTIYTERYMGLPQDNGDGYDDNSPLGHVAELKGNYLLVHGLGDDNVHYQNSAEMTMALVKAGKQFDQFNYPDKNHGIYGGTTRWHLFEMMTDWLERKL
ncbi:MAG: S9 family peptidase [Flavobacteriales bacterium]|nr:S9 family peptidase [Flavobacteriales bacterium]MCB9167537.1 S9 family peptidase [Flavobacteriales bacterium]